MSITEQRIGRYVRLEPIGRGAMGVVYRAQDPLIHRTVAVKVLLPSKGMDAQQRFIARERFRREAQAAGGIDHPHIVRIFDVGEDEASGELYIVMEHLPGPSLESMINEGELAPSRSVEIIGQIASGLDAAHEREIVHRDVKPSNILFTHRGAAKIVDFGITQVASSSLTQDMSKLGTPAYMSPEQVAGKPLDAQADLFSLGVLSYEILTGKKPFTGIDVVSIAYAITHSDPVRISEANPQLPSALDRVFDLMLAKDPADRFTSGKAFHEALVRCLGEASPMRTPALVAASRRRTRALWATVGVAALGAVALIAFSDGVPIEPKPPEIAKAVPPTRARSVTSPSANATSSPRTSPRTSTNANITRAPIPTAQATISLSHRIREGTLVVSMDGVSIFNERFSKAKLALVQTTTWDPVQVSAGKHKLTAKVIGDGGTIYSSEVYTVELPRSQEATFRIKFKGDKLVVQQG